MTSTGMSTPDEAKGQARLSINEATVKYATVPQVVQLCRDAGIESVGLWRENVADFGLEASAKLVSEAGLRVSSLCRGGFFTAVDPDARAEALASNRAAIDEAAALGAPTLVLVAGGLADGDKDLAATRERARQAIADLVPYAQAKGVNLSIEPMHPIFAADRGVVSTLSQALDIAETFSERLSDGRPVVSVVVDTYHVFWDPYLAEQIARAGELGMIASYQVGDWQLPLASDTLLSRGYMGDGAIDFETITRQVMDAGYTGDIEVEIFRQEIWDDEPAEVIATVADRFSRLVAPFC